MSTLITFVAPSINQGTLNHSIMILSPLRDTYRFLSLFAPEPLGSLSTTPTISTLKGTHRAL